ncbi:low-density lipoprotein receptor-related protein 2-like isoform X2 [Babylonia areolata]|uniref:low-density lipoprotein receptor-related protein 2-like isoform X2 n=1 Tax=Babylonia areolata TaxID=304850 RepID=UPI003FCF85BA
MRSIMTIRTAEEENLTTFQTNARLKVVVSTSLDAPYGVTVLPQIKRLFWSDIGAEPKLESSDLLGADRRVLLWQGLVKPTAMCADHTTNRLYWVDEVKATVESCDQEGKGRRIVVSFAEDSSTLKGLQVFEDVLIVADRGKEQVQAYNKGTGTQSASPVTGAANIGDVTVFSSALQPRDSATCDSTSCDHICIHGERGQCVCASGYATTDGGKTCTEQATSLWKSFLVSTGSEICAVPVNLLFSHRYLRTAYINSSILCFVQSGGGVDSIDFLAVDPRNATLYYNVGRHLKWRKIYTADSEDRFAFAGGVITGMAYDWMSGTLVWTQQSPQYVFRKTDSDATSVSVYRNVSNPSHITVDPFRGSIFWIESPAGASSAQIWSGTVRGSQAKVSVLSSGIRKPRDLTYDYKTDKLYWLDEDHVGTIDPDGKNKHIKPLNSLSTYRGLAILRSYVVWSTEGGSGVSQFSFRSVDLTENDTITTFNLTSKIGDVTNIVFFDASVNQESGTVSCELDNGGCSQLCQVNGSSHHCLCHFGYQLDRDGVNCTSAPMTSNFFLVIDTLSNQMYQVNGAGSQVSAVPTERGAKPELAVFNWATGDIIWYDSVAAAIKLSPLNGGSSGRVVRSLKEAGQPSPNTVGALCVDRSTNNLYFTERKADNSKGWVRVISLDSPHVMKTLYEPSSTPRHLDIDPANGQLVFGTDAGSIFLTEMSMESPPTELLSSVTIVTSLSGLTFSDNGATVQWADDKADGLWRMPLSTQVEERRLTSTGSHPRALTAWGATLYYLTGSGRTINSLSDSGTESRVAEFPELGRLTSLHFFGPRAPEESTECSQRNGRCSTLCLPTPTGRQCQCGDGVSLLSDQRTCSDVEQCPNAVRNGQLTTSCDRYPGETCQFTCSEGHAPSPAHPAVRCGASGTWNASLEALCPRACPRRVRDGQMDAACSLVTGSACRVTCDAGFEATAAAAAGSVECGQDGEWTVPSDKMCAATESEGEALPTYAIGIICAGAVAILAVLIGCFLYRRMKKYGGKDSNRDNFAHLAAAGAHGHHNPAIIVTPDLGEGATGGKVVDEDARSEVYAELEEEPGPEPPRYSTFSKISPVPGKKFDGRSRSPIPGGADGGGFYNPAFNNDSKAAFRNPPETDLSPYSRSLSGDAPRPHGPGSQDNYLTPSRLPAPQPHRFHPSSGPSPGGAEELMPPPDYMQILPPSPRPAHHQLGGAPPGPSPRGAELVPMKNMSSQFR